MTQAEAVETDVLVVGSGAGALTAAFTAATAGAKVLVVEKAAVYGGTSATSGGGIWIPCSEQALAAGHADTPEEAFGYIKALVGDDVADQRIQTYVREAPRMLAFLQGRSHVRFTPAAYADYHMDVAGSKEGGRTHDPLPLMADRLGADYATLRPPHPLTLTFGRFTWTMAEAQLLMTGSPGAGKVLAKVLLSYALDLPWRLKTKRSRRLTAGNALIGALKLSLNEAGVPIWLNTPMRSLIEEGGRVTGAVVERDGRQVRVTARRGVVLAAGGFDNDAELRERYLPKPTRTEWTSGVGTNTGDALRAGVAVGAKLDLIDSAWWAPGFKLEGEDRSRPMFVERALPGCIIVDQTGRRYMNEAASYHVAGGLMHQVNGPDHPTIPSYFVFDARYRGKYMLGLITPGSPKRDHAIPAPMRAILKRADTVEDLARQINVDPQALAQTVERFNGMARTGVDEDFHRGRSAYDRHYGDRSVKPNPTLAPLAQAPFYALPIYPCDLGTNGGLATDAAGRVIDQSDRPIPGLYAIGNCSAAVMGRTYPGAGATLGPAMTFGYLAARHAVGANT